MRDDIHKKVPRPPSIQRWVRLSVSDADRLAGRPFDALNRAQLDACRREIAPAFIREFVAELNSTPGLFGHLASAHSPRDLGGQGGPLEMDILSEAKRLVAMRLPPMTVAALAIANVMELRAQADIRAAAAVFPVRDPKSVVVLNSMRDDVRRADFRGLGESVVNGAVFQPGRRSRQSFDLDGDLRVGAMGGGL